MLEYQYPHSLTRHGQIRLVRLYAGDQTDPLELAYDYTDLDDPVEYEAVSHTWGDQLPNTRVMVHNGREFTYQTVTPNLQSVLQRLRHEHKERVIWLDTLCINQQSGQEEKNAQVKSMDRVYSKATRVCIWLGQSEGDSDLAIRLIEQIFDCDNFEGLLEDKTKRCHWKALIDLMRRPYFTRRWVVQEIALAKEAILYCGGGSVDWLKFAKVVELCRSQSLKIAKLLDRVSRTKDTNGRLEEVQGLSAITLVDATKNVFRKDDEGRILERCASFEYLLSELTAFHVSKPADMIYALRSLAKEVQGPDDFDIDYSKPLIEICRDVVEISIRSSKSLDIICRPWAPITIDMPTWMRYASEAQYAQTSDGKLMRANADRFVGKPGHPIYHASGSEKARVNFNVAQTQLSYRTSPKTMIAEGIFVDYVSVHGGQSIDGLIPRQWQVLGGWKDVSRNVPDQFWRTMVADRDPDGNKAPRWYKRACMHAWSQKSRNCADFDTKESPKRFHSPRTQEFLRRVQSVTCGRSLIVTKKHGLLGLAPATTNIEGYTDIVCLLYGCSVPVILRARHGGSFHHLIGEAYIHGIMEGETIQDLKYHSKRQHVFEIQ